MDGRRWIPKDSLLRSQRLQVLVAVGFFNICVLSNRRPKIEILLRYYYHIMFYSFKLYFSLRKGSLWKILSSFTLLRI